MSIGRLFKKIDYWKFCAILIGIALILSSISVSIRYVIGSPVQFSSESFYHMRVSKGVFSSQISQSDNFSDVIKPFFINPYHLLLGFISQIAGYAAASVLLPILL